MWKTFRKDRLVEEAHGDSVPEVWVIGSCEEGSWRYPGMKKTRRSAEKKKGRTNCIAFVNVIAITPCE